AVPRDRLEMRLYGEFLALGRAQPERATGRLRPAAVVVIGVGEYRAQTAAFFQRGERLVARQRKEIAIGEMKHIARVNEDGHGQICKDRRIDSAAARACRPRKGGGKEGEVVAPRAIR